MHPLVVFRYAKHNLYYGRTGSHVPVVDLNKINEAHYLTQRAGAARAIPAPPLS